MGAIRKARSPTGGARMSSNPENFAPVYSSAFLLERRDGWPRPPRRGATSWTCATGRGWELTAAWPRQELQRVLGLLEKRKDPATKPPAGPDHRPSR